MKRELLLTKGFSLFGVLWKGRESERRKEGSKRRKEKPERQKK